MSRFGAGHTWRALAHTFVRAWDPSSHSVASDGVGLTVGHVWSLAARVGIIRLIVYSIFFPSSKTIVSPFIDNPLFLKDSSLLVVSGGKTFMILPLVLVSSAGPSSFVYQVGMSDAPCFDMPALAAGIRGTLGANVSGPAAGSSASLGFPERAANASDES